MAATRLVERVAVAGVGISSVARSRWERLSGWRRLLFAGAVLFAVLLLVLVPMLLTRVEPGGTSDIPANLPPEIRRDLRDLHRAVNE